ncbi:MAG: hypothetical protein IJ094_02925 [Bacilli bacterium]|nr:hypothetical protein [Bacilli bacterium]
MNKNKGISLIVLIVTIIVIIILAAVVFLTISKNNPIESAKEARFKEDVRTFQDELALSVSKEYTAKAGQRDNKFTATKFSKIQKYIPSFNKNYEGKFVIKQDELVYKTENLTEKELEMVQNLNVRENIKTSAEIIEEDANTAYGANVTNYSSNGVSEWKIFYSDGQHVYLISSKYIDVNKLPATKNGYKPENCNAEYPKTANFDNVLKDYNGSPDITDERLKELNYDYFVKGYSSNDNNMKAVAYMLDIDIWSIFARGKNAEYAIGGPTIEMVFNSYNQKYDKSYISKVFENEIGYKISVDGGNNYGAWYAWILNNDPLYVLQ